MKPRLSIDAITVRELEGFARQAVRSGLAGGSTVPISVNRAVAWARNPYAEADDVALLVARAEDRYLGYLGLMPGLVRIGSELEKVYWCSTLYVLPDYRTTGVGGMLMMRALALDYTLVAAGPSEEASPMYRALAFREMKLRYAVLDLRGLNVLSWPLRGVRRVLRKGGQETPHLDRAIARSGVPTKSIAYGVLRRSLHRNPSLASDIVDADDLRTTIDQWPLEPSGPYFFRGTECLDWMVQWPWVTRSSEARTEGYYFDDFREEFSFTFLRLRSLAGSAAGFMILRLAQRDGIRDLLLLDHRVAPDVEPDAVFSTVLEHAARCRADRVSLPEAWVPQSATEGLIGRLLGTAERQYYCRPKKQASRIGGMLQHLQLDLSDGDIAFA